MQEQEIWKDIEGYNGAYQVSNMGRVRSFKGRGVKILKASISTPGYTFVKLSLEGKGTIFYIHRLVAEYFCKGYRKGLHVDHVNGTKTDNRFFNLRWVTRLHNNELFSQRRSVFGVGVTYYKNKYRAQIRFKGKNKTIGRYDTPEQARQARQDFKTKHNLK